MEGAKSNAWLAQEEPSQSSEACRTQPTSRSYDVNEKGCWVKLGKREREESNPLDS